MSGHFSLRFNPLPSRSTIWHRVPIDLVKFLMLCCVVLCCVVLCCVVLCCVVMCYVTLRYVTFCLLVMLCYVFPGYITNQFNDQLPVGLLAQLVRALHRCRRGQGSNPSKPDFFRLSFRNCISCVNNCEDLLYIDLCLCYVMLCYVMLCYVMLCYVMLCYVMLCYVMLCLFCSICF